MRLRIAPTTAKIAGSTRWLPNCDLEDAIVQGVARASKTLREVKGAWVKEQEVTVRNNKVVAYKVILKVTFVLEDAA